MSEIKEKSVVVPLSLMQDVVDLLLTLPWVQVNSLVRRLQEEVIDNEDTEDDSDITDGISS